MLKLAFSSFEKIKKSLNIFSEGESGNSSPPTRGKPTVTKASFGRLSHRWWGFLATNKYEQTSSCGSDMVTEDRELT